MGFRLFLLRHGETLWNRQRRYQGCVDTALSPEGIAQAEAASLALTRRPLAHVYSSPLRRARETAEAVARRHGHGVRVDLAFRELCHGLWEGLTVEEVRAQFPDLYAAWRATPETVTMPNGESLLQVRARVLDGLERLAAAHDGESVCLVAHGAPIRLLILEALGLPPGRLWAVHCSPGGLTEVEFRAQSAILHRMNVLSHLEANGQGC
jgi:broad specificity phosphatase PhoE